MSVRTEQTLRDMWEAGLKRRSEAEANSAEAVRCTAASDAHDLAAANARAAAQAEAQAAQSARSSAKALFDLAEGRAAEAADLADMVNRERQEIGLALLVPGEPYPADPAGQAPAEPVVVSRQSVTETATDGLDTSGATS